MRSNESKTSKVRKVRGVQVVTSNPSPCENLAILAGCFLESKVPADGEPGLESLGITGNDRNDAVGAVGAVGASNQQSGVSKSIGTISSEILAGGCHGHHGNEMPTGGEPGWTSCLTNIDKSCKSGISPNHDES